MGTSLGEVSVSVGADISSFTRNMAVVSDSMKAFQAASGNVANGIGNLASQAKAGISQIGGFGSKILDGAKSLLNFGQQLGFSIMGLKSLAGAALGAAQSLIEPNAELEQTTIAFTQMLGSGEKARAFLNDLQTFANSSPFEFNDLTAASKHLLAFGFAAKDVIPIMTSVGDATSALGAGQDGIDRVTTALGQMRAAGKLNAQDMMQLTSVGIPAWQILADQMHLTVAQVQQLSQAGKISSEEVIPKLIAGMEKAYGGQMASQAKTFNGIVSNLQDVWSTLTRTLTKPIFDVAKQGLQQVAQVMESPAFANFVRMLGEKIAGAVTSLASFINTNLKPPALWLIDFFQKFNTQILNDEPIGLLIGSLRNLAAAIGGAVMPPLQTLGNFLNENLQPHALSTQDAINGIEGAISNTGVVLDDFSAGIRNLTSFFQSNSIQAQIVKDLMLGIGVAIAAVQIGEFVAGIPALVAGFLTWAGAAWTAAAGTIAATWPILAIIAVIALLVAAIVLAVQHWSDITGFLSGVWSAFCNWFMGLLGGIGAWFTGLWNGIASWFTNWWNLQVAAFQAIGNLLGGIWQSIWTWIYDTIISKLLAIWNGIVSFFAPVVAYFGAVFQTIWNIISAIIGKVASWLYSKWMEIYTSAQIVWAYIHAYISLALALIESTIMGIVTPIVKWLSDRWNEVSAAVQLAWSFITGLISGAWDTISQTVNEKLVQLGLFLIGKWEEIKGNVSGAWSAISGTVSDWWARISSTVSSKFAQIKDNILKPFTAARDAVGGVIKGMVNNIIHWLNNGIAGAEGFVNRFGDAINWIAQQLGTKGTIPHVSFGRIPAYASGTAFHPGGPAIVGEKGPELVMLPRGASVLPNGPTAQLLRGGLIPGYADGTSNAVQQVLNWIGGGISSMLNSALSMFGATGFQLPGFLNQLATAAVSSIDNIALTWIQSAADVFKNAHVGMANGGIIREPIAGIGLNSGTRYAFGEKGAEAVVPLSGNSGSSGKVINITLELDGKVLARATAPAIVQEIRLRTGNRF